MSANYYRPAEPGISEQYASGIKKRLRLLLLFSTITVALAFGLSFYFGLISGESALMKQFPELAPIASQMKSLLLMNTLGFVAIIIASFYVLGRLSTSRMFIPLASMEKMMTDFVDSGRLPEDRPESAGPFDSMVDAFDSMVSRLGSDVEKELAVLREAAAGAGPELRQRIEALIKTKERSLGIKPGVRSDAEKAEGDRDGIFMQQV